MIHGKDATQNGGYNLADFRKELSNLEKHSSTIFRLADLTSFESFKKAPADLSAKRP